MPISHRGEEILARLRQTIEDCEARGVEWYLRGTISGVDVDTTDTGCEGYARGSLKGLPSAEMVTADVSAKVIKLHIGTLEIYSEGTPAGAAFHKTRVLLDGKPFPCRAIRLDGHVSRPWAAAIDFFPASVRKAQEGSDTIVGGIVTGLGKESG